MLYAISESYFIDISDIAHIRCEPNPKDNANKYPYRMCIRMKDGQQYSVAYSDKRRCQNEIGGIVSRHNQLAAVPVTRYELEAITRNETERLKRYLRKLADTYFKERTEDREKS